MITFIINFLMIIGGLVLACLLLAVGTYALAWARYEIEKLEEERRQ